ncbi:MAG: GNAT family N-acetyltransferase [Tannerellaceae bacterium]|jgi:hypothetical protein|nr:GNAT family N-acetyltransferase [Tannerellaceae bacterium]
MKDKYRSLCRIEASIPVFSQDWWLDIVCGSNKWDVLLVEENGRIQAALPFYTPHPKVVSMPPYTQTMGPWFAPETSDTKYTTLLGQRQMLCKTFTDGLKKYPSFLQNFNYQVTDWLPFYWQGYKQTTRYTYLLRDIHHPEGLWANMRPNIRRNITKAKEKFKINIERGVPEDEFLSVYSLTFKRQDRQPPHVDTLKKLITQCRERKQGDIWGGYDTEGKLHAVAFIVWQGSVAYYLAGGGDPALRESGAHSLVLWEGIKDVSVHTTLFDFEGSMIQGVERFFREFGAVQTPFFTISKNERSLLYKIRTKLGI